MNNIAEKEISEYINAYINKKKENCWKNEKKYTDFLLFLLNLIETQENKVILSDSFYYNDYLLKGNYTVEEFDILFNSLYDEIKKYSASNFIDDYVLVKEDDIFTESSISVKINNKFYLISLVLGQGSYISFELLNEFNEKEYSYVDYELMIKKECSNMYFDNAKKMIFNKLNNIILEMNISKEMFNNIINEYLNH